MKKHYAYLVIYLFHFPKEHLFIYLYIYIYIYIYNILKYNIHCDTECIDIYKMGLKTNVNFYRKIQKSTHYSSLYTYFTIVYIIILIENSQYLFV